MNIVKEKKFGKPDDNTKLFVKELYCFMCNRIPYMDTWDRSSGKIVGVEISDLFPVETSIGFGPNAVVVDMMICLGCIDRIEAKMRAEIKRRLGISQGPFNSPGGNPGAQGGGVGVPRQ